MLINPQTGDGGSIKCPVCRIDFTEIQSGSSLEPAGDEILEDVQVSVSLKVTISKLYAGHSCRAWLMKCLKKKRFRGFGMSFLVNLHPHLLSSKSTLFDKWQEGKKLPSSKFVINICVLKYCHPWGAGMTQGWRSGESTHLPPMWLGFDSRRHMWVEFVVGSLLALTF